MYWGEELVAIYNEAYIGMLKLDRTALFSNQQTRPGRPETSSAHGPELQSCLGGDLARGQGRFRKCTPYGSSDYEGRRLPVHMAEWFHRGGIFFMVHYSNGR